MNAIFAGAVDLDVPPTDPIQKLPVAGHKPPDRVVFTGHLARAEAVTRPQNSSHAQGLLLVSPGRGCMPVEIAEHTPAQQEHARQVRPSSPAPDQTIQNIL